MKRDRDLADMKLKLEELRDKVGDEAAEIIDELEARLDNLKATINEELAELEEVGLMKWVQLNPRKALLVAVVAGGGVMLAGALLM